VARLELRERAARALVERTQPVARVLVERAQPVVARVLAERARPVARVALQGQRVAPGPAVLRARAAAGSPEWEALPSMPGNHPVRARVVVRAAAEAQVARTARVELDKEARPEVIRTDPRRPNRWDAPAGWPHRSQAPPWAVSSR
jgi:hypothetical protein